MQPWIEPRLVAHACLLVESYQRMVGRPLLHAAGDTTGIAGALYRAPFVVVSHDTADPPCLNYGNQRALELWEMSWPRLIGTPSRETAEAAERAARERLLERVAREGFVDDYTGIRVSSRGRRFRIDRATVWAVVSPEGRPAGQAATFSEVTFLDP